MTTVFDTAIVGGAIQAGATEVVIDTSDEAIALTPEERAEELAFDIGTAYDLLTDARIARAALTFISLDLIVQECARRGHQVCLHQVCRLTKQKVIAWHDEPLTEETLPFDAERTVRLSSLPPGYPPLADEDALPFDGEDRRT